MTSTPTHFPRVSHLNVHLIVVNPRATGSSMFHYRSCVCCSVVLRTFNGHISGCLALPEPKNYTAATSMHHALRLMQDEAMGPVSQKFYSGL